ncbi:MAG: FHA domain-containing protein [Microbacteriaceae bacterium]
MNQADEIGRKADTTLGFNRDALAAIAGIEEDLSAEEIEAIASLPHDSALLVVRRGPNTGARFLLDTDVATVGRHPDADIFLDDVTVSRRHAQFLRDDHTFSVRDLGSLNGTYLGGERIEADVVLNDADEVQIGKFRLTFYASRQAGRQ